MGIPGLPPGPVLCVIRVVNGRARCETHNGEFANPEEVQAHRQEKLEEWRASQAFQDALKAGGIELTTDLSKIKDPAELMAMLSKRLLAEMDRARQIPPIHGHVEIHLSWGDKLTIYLMAETLEEIKAKVKEIRDTFFEWTRSG